MTLEYAIVLECVFYNIVIEDVVARVCCMMLPRYVNDYHIMQIDNLVACYL